MNRSKKTGYLSLYRDKLRAVRPGFDSRQEQNIYLLVSASGLTLEPTQPLQWLPWGRVARPKREADHTPPHTVDEELYLHYSIVLHGVVPRTTSHLPTNELVSCRLCLPPESQ